MATSELKGGPAAATPRRPRPSVRRTTTHDSVRPQGLLGPVTVIAQGRDLLTGEDGRATVLATARLDAEVQYLPNRVVSSIGLDPPHPGVKQLVGRAASTGFRQAVEDAMPGERTSRTVRYQLLDDLPTALLVSGFAIQAAGVPVRRKGPMLQHPDMCAGWVTGGMMLTGMNEEGRPPPHRGPVAPDIEPEDDPLGWHSMDPLPHDGMRRRRRIDVWPEGEVAMIDCFFRDSHIDSGGTETVVHEYTVRGEFDPGTGRFVRCEAEVGALPWPECPNAAASAQRLGGAPAEGLRAWVRETFVGTTTCTHLNDTLRSLEDVEALLRVVR